MVSLLPAPLDPPRSGSFELNGQFGAAQLAASADMSVPELEGHINMGERGEEEEEGGGHGAGVGLKRLHMHTA